MINRNAVRGAIADRDFVGQTQRRDGVPPQEPGYAWAHPARDRDHGHVRVCLQHYLDGVVNQSLPLRPRPAYDQECSDVRDLVEIPSDTRLVRIFV